ncbi:USE1 [Lepeophtheirus salmonis]|uniref:Vesicle transport protein USE1 n=1 Tax=Lepeophtheirus salmonis TaxID=72036 RepID=A0A0K2TXL4_LEPSM|nr:USE1 [Lepeophtheirus salmonis]CAF2912053.1 USE1 [Lepeophtheirus salmonis]
MKSTTGTTFRILRSEKHEKLSEDEVRFNKMWDALQSLVSEGTYSGEFDPRIGPFLRRLEGLLFKIGQNSENIEEYEAKLKSLNNFVDEDKLFDFDYDLPREQKRSAKSPSNAKQNNRLIIPPPPLANLDNDSVQKEIFRKTIERYRAQDRKELFESNKGESSRLRKRRDEQSAQSLIHDQDVAQEEIAEQMLSLTKSLKEQTEAANRMIHRDISSLEGTRRTADENIDKLAVESDRLQEHRSTFNCRCWIWILMFIVVMTFLKMLVIMKLFKKPT